MANTSRMNRLEELGRVDAEKAYTKKGKRNLKDEEKRIVGELKATGGKVGTKSQGYKDREDESLGMRTGKESGKKQSMQDRRDESYGAWGKRPNQKINKSEGNKWIQKKKKEIRNNSQVKPDKKQIEWISKKKKPSTWITKKKKPSTWIKKRSRDDIRERAAHASGGRVMGRGQGKVMRDRPTFMISMKD